MSFTNIMCHGTVTRLDIAVDLVGIRIDDIDVQFNGAGKSHWYYSSTGQAQTGYLGMKKSAKNAPWVAYNKRQEIKDKGTGAGVPLYGGLSHTRIEYHAKPNKPFSQLGTMQNPFANISLGHPQAPKGVKPHAWSFFLDACQRRGHENALALIPNDPLRKRYQGALKRGHEAFWRPEAIWSRWEDALIKSLLL